MNKQQARAENKDMVMFCHEGSFFTFYDVDALIVNRVCGHKIIPSGSRPKAGVPLSNTSVFASLEQEGIPYFAYKKDVGIIKRHDAPANKYTELSATIIEELKANDKTVEQYFAKAERQVASIKPTQSKLEILISGQDPYTNEIIAGMSDKTRNWLKELNKSCMSLHALL